MCESITRVRPASLFGQRPPGGDRRISTADTCGGHRKVHYQRDAARGKAARAVIFSTALGLVSLVGQSRPLLAGGGPENVLLVVNSNSESSRTIANHYMHWRKIPPSNVLYIDWRRSLVNTPVEHFRNELLQPMLEAIDGRKLAMQIDYLVYSSDFPWRILMQADFADRELPSSFRPVASLTGATYLWPSVQMRHVGVLSPSSNWYVPQSPQNNQASCVELGNASSRGFRFQYLWTPSGGRTNSTEHGQRYAMSMMLGVTNGRGNTVDEILSYLRRSIEADATRPSGTFYLMKGAGPRSAPRHDCFVEAAGKLRQLGVKAEVLEGALPNNRGDVLGIMTGVREFDLNQARVRLLPGAICDHLTSLGGDLRSNASQTPLTEFLRHGAAAACGTVIEPYAIQAKFPLPSLPIHYARGCSAAEAFYQSVSGPYQLLIVGDPLCQPWATPPGVEVAGVTADDELSGTVTLQPSITAAPGRGARFFEVYVDGVLKTRVPPKKPVALDTTELDDGYHEIRVVAVDSQPIECQGRLIVPVTVNNHDRQMELTVSPAGEVGAGSTITLSARLEGAEEIEILANGREIERLTGEEGQVTLSAATLGRGPVQFQARATGSVTAISRPVLVDIN